MKKINGKSENLFQHTLKRPVHCTGVGLHSGSKVSLSIAPADAGTGIRFIRSDKRGTAAHLSAQWDQVIDTRMCTVLGNDDGTTIGTIEHLMAALAGAGVDNAVITLDGPEVPIMDGSAAPFVAMLECVGLSEQRMPRRAIRILKPITVGEGSKFATYTPAPVASFSFEIDFDNAVVARQSRTFTLAPEAFRDEIGEARTFGFLHEVDYLRSVGLARGGSLENAVVISGDTVLNEGGLRFEDEFVRHKILDAVGDLYLAGAPIIGHFHGCRSGHALNNQLLHALFADESAWCFDPPAVLAPVSWSSYGRHAAVA